MAFLIFFHPGNPDLFELFGVVFGILLAAFLMNAVFDFVKRRLLKKKEASNPLPPKDTMNNLII